METDEPIIDRAGAGALASDSEAESSESGASGSAGYDTDDSFIDDSELVADVAETDFFQAAVPEFQMAQAAHKKKAPPKDKHKQGGDKDKSKSAKAAVQYTFPPRVQTLIDQFLQLAKSRGELAPPTAAGGGEAVDAKPRRLPSEYYELLLKLGR